MPITLRELARTLRLPVLAGDVSKPVGWVHGTELADPTPFLEGGELLLTTGLRPIDTGYVERLVRAGVVGLGFGTGLGHDVVPPGLVAAVRRSQRRRSWVTAGIAAAAAVLAVAGTAVVVDHLDSHPSSPTAVPTSPPTAKARPMDRVAGSTDPMVASVSLTTVDWGTRLDLTCSYPVSRTGEYLGREK